MSASDVYRYRSYFLRPGGNLELQTPYPLLFDSLPKAMQGSSDAWEQVTPEIWTEIKQVPDGDKLWMALYVIDKLQVFS